jgi:hypothetical protein
LIEHNTDMMERMKRNGGGAIRIVTVADAA